ncbi:357_t:CDS:2 [Paraglomus occultum]|uniref:357_t:CDS:1 n=1 Tax=Paraglomus occultum TaxID=144539 RepID=A0A9N9CID5_9GLOM|nr:357_t:CDS:2 [Paraglomus occultum]
MHFLLALPIDIFKLVASAAILNILILLSLIVLNKGRAMSAYKLPICVSILVTCFLFILTKQDTTGFSDFENLSIRYEIALGFHQLTIMMIVTVVIYVLTQTNYNRVDHSFRVISLIVLWISGVVYAVLTLGPLWSIVGANVYKTLVYTVFAIRAIMILYTMALIIEGPVYILVIFVNPSVAIVPIVWSIVIIVILFLLSCPIEQFDDNSQESEVEQSVNKIDLPKRGSEIGIRFENGSGNQGLRGQQQSYSQQQAYPQPTYSPQAYLSQTYSSQQQVQTQAQRQQTQAQSQRQQAYIPQHYEQQSHRQQAQTSSQSYDRRGYEQPYVPQSYEPAAYKPRTYEPQTYEPQTYERQQQTYSSRTHDSQDYYSSYEQPSYAQAGGRSVGRTNFAQGRPVRYSLSSSDDE